MRPLASSIRSAETGRCNATPSDSTYSMEYGGVPAEDVQASAMPLPFSEGKTASTSIDDRASHREVSLDDCSPPNAGTLPLCLRR